MKLNMKSELIQKKETEELKLIPSINQKSRKIAEKKNSIM